MKTDGLRSCLFYFIIIVLVFSKDGMFIFLGVTRSLVEFMKPSLLTDMQLIKLRLMLIHGAP